MSQLSPRDELIAELLDLAETLRHILIAFWKLGAVQQHSNLSARLMSCADMIEWIVSDLSEKVPPDTQDLPF